MEIYRFEATVDTSRRNRNGRILLPIFKGHRILQHLAWLLSGSPNAGIGAIRPMRLGPEVAQRADLAITLISAATTLDKIEASVRHPTWLHFDDTPNGRCPKRELSGVRIENLFCAWRNGALNDLE